MLAAIVIALAITFALVRVVRSFPTAERIAKCRAARDSRAASFSTRWRARSDYYCVCYYVHLGASFVFFDSGVFFYSQVGALTMFCIALTITLATGCVCRPFPTAKRAKKCALAFASIHVRVARSSAGGGVCRDRGPSRPLLFLNQTLHPWMFRATMA